MFKPKKKRRPKRQFIIRKKVCSFCVEKAKTIDYKDIAKLTKFTTERGKMIPRRVSGVCAKHQRVLAMAIKRARFIALIPYIRK
ncbi:MAG: 30S ribosomal protein S18 [Candidatus Omnitrophica bacterium]|nr:30S ribosomal protein S18 [Candidatus Omnitrophota bacterium]